MGEKQKDLQIHGDLTSQSVLLLQSLGELGGKPLPPAEWDLEKGKGKGGRGFCTPAPGFSSDHGFGL